MKKKIIDWIVKRRLEKLTDAQYIQCYCKESFVVLKNTETKGYLFILHNGTVIDSAYSDTYIETMISTMVPKYLFAAIKNSNYLRFGSLDIGGTIIVKRFKYCDGSIGGIEVDIDAIKSILNVYKFFKYY